MHIGGKTGRRRLGRCATLVTAVALAVTAAAGSAAAGTTSQPTSLDLVNYGGYGAYAEQGVVNGSEVGVASSPGKWLSDDAHSTWTGGSPKVTGENFEFQAVTSKGITSQWCIGTGTDSTGNSVYLTSCGANGTVWVVVKSGNGYLLYSRYWLNLNVDVVLADYDPGHSDSELACQYESGLTSGDGYYSRWAFAFN